MAGSVPRVSLPTVLFLGIFLDEALFAIGSCTALLQDTLLVFRLDGSLLDIHTYAGSRQCRLDKLQDFQVPLILCSSKTAAEMQDIQQDLGLEGLPFIAENGAVIQPDVRWEKAQRHTMGMLHRDIRPFIEQIRMQAGYKFTTLTMSMTG